MEFANCCLLLSLVVAGVLSSTPVTVVNSWPGGFQGEACVDITETINGWTAQLLFQSPVNAVEQWVGTVHQVSSTLFKVSNPETLTPGTRKCFIIVVRCDCTQAIPTEVFIEGNTGTHNGGGDGGSGGGSSTGGTGGENRQAVTILEEWNGGYKGEACVDITETINGWTAQLHFQSAANAVEQWVGTVHQVSSTLFKVSNPETLTPGTRKCFIIVVRCDCTQAIPTEVFIEGNTGTNNGGGDGGSGGGSSTGGTGGENRQAVTILEEWNGGYKGEACVDITETINGWTAQLHFQSAANAVEQWVGTVQQVSSTLFKVSNPETLTPGTRKCFIIVVRCDCTQAIPTEVFIEGNTGTDNGGGDGGSGGGGSTGGTGGENRQAVTILEEWNGGYKGEACVDITETINGWTAQLHFQSPVNAVEQWVGTVQQVSSTLFKVSNPETLTPGTRKCFIIVVRCDCTQAIPTEVFIEGNTGTDNGGGDGGSGGGGSTGDATKDYARALGLSILFYDAQRSGPLPANNPIPWRGNSALGDCVVGGWYDAGDHVKFGLPMASSSTLLLWSLIKFKDGYQRAGQLDMMYDMIKWPLDYYLAAWDNSAQSLVVQVGDGNLDHQYWGRAEDMTMNRPCQSVNSGSKGSDIAAETAASLAAGAIAFSDKGDTSYASTLLTAAKQLFSFATSNRGVFYGSSPFYSSSGDTDELCTAAMWLYRATGDNSYLNQAKTFATTGTAWALSWDDKKLACQILLYEAGESSYRSAVENFFNSWLPNGGIPYTPCGLAWRDTWGANRYAGNAAFAALLAAEAGINSGVYRKWAAEQINYMLGDNNINGGCYSFLVGYGSAYPQQPHHRGASCPNRPAPCGQNEYNNPGPNYQVLNGALVGGPDQSGNYNDVRSDYIANEVATDYNSGFQGALAGLVHLEEIASFPATSNSCPCGQ